MARRVLLVDDDAVFRRAFARVLQSAGYLVVQAGDVSSGVEALLSGVELAIVDFDLPDGTGLELALGAQELLGKASPPLILASAALDRLGDAQKAPFTAIHGKPVDLPRLLDDVDRLAQERVRPKSSGVRARAVITHKRRDAKG